MAKSEIHKNDANLGLRFTIKDENDNVVNLSGAAKKDIIFKKPNNVKFTKSGSLVTDGTDGVIQYATATGDLDTVGYWRAQCFVDLGSSGSFYSDVVKFKVHDNL